MLNSGIVGPAMNNVLLVEPIYYTRYPPLGLLKLSTYYKNNNYDVKFVRGNVKIPGYEPDVIEITSLFTYRRKAVHESIEYYHEQFPDAVLNVGGIYASLMNEEVITKYPYVNVQIGLNPNADSLLPDYSILKQVEKWKDWDGSILFTSRGCVNNCPFCVVPKLEGKMRSVIDKPSQYVQPGHKTVILWDNNFLALPDWYEKLMDLKELNLWIDFNQGLDARLITPEKAEVLSSMKIRDYRMAYDGDYEKKAVHRAVGYFRDCGLSMRKISFYTLFNFYSDSSHNYDTPETFYKRVLDILEMGCISYPMRYVPLDAESKNDYVSPMWTSEQLEAVAKARRVIGFGGAFPPYRALVEKFRNANGFDEAFKLRPHCPKKKN